MPTGQKVTRVSSCMTTIRQNTARDLRRASLILLLCIICASYAVAAEPVPSQS